MIVIGNRLGVAPEDRDTLLRWSDDMLCALGSPDPTAMDRAAIAAMEYAERLQAHHDSLIENVKSSQDTQARYYDAKHKRVEFAVGDDRRVLDVVAELVAADVLGQQLPLTPHVGGDRIGL